MVMGPPLFRLGVIADAQYGDKPDAGPRRFHSSMRRLADAVAHFNSLGVLATVHLGDLIDGGLILTYLLRGFHRFSSTGGLELSPTER